MQQLFIVYVREKYKKYWSLFSAFEYKLRGATWGDQLLYSLDMEFSSLISTLKDERN